MYQIPIAFAYHRFEGYRPQGEIPIPNQIHPQFELFKPGDGDSVSFVGRSKTNKPQKPNQAAGQGVKR